MAAEFVVEGCEKPVIIKYKYCFYDREPIPWVKTRSQRFRRRCGNWKMIFKSAILLFDPCKCWGPGFMVIVVDDGETKYTFRLIRKNNITTWC